MGAPSLTRGGRCTYPHTRRPRCRRRARRPSRSVPGRSRPMSVAYRRLDPGGAWARYQPVAPRHRQRGAAAVKMFPDASPSWLATDPSGKFVYAVNEIDTFGPDKTGSVTAFYAFDRCDRRTNSLYSAVGARGAGSTFGSVHPSGKFMFVANYARGTSRSCPIQANGCAGRGGGRRALHGPPAPGAPRRGRQATSRSAIATGRTRHMIASDPTGRFVIPTISASTGRSSGDRSRDRQADPNDPAFVATASAGAGPRHFAFHPNGRVLYNLYEEASQFAVYDWNPQTAATTLKQKVLDAAGIFAAPTSPPNRRDADARFL